ncbi:MAG: hypothetical protein V3T28_00785 [Gemmatimonadales bacterium]
MQRITFFALAGALIGAAACAGGIRPSYSPLVNARVDTVNAEPAAVIQELASRVLAERLRIQWTSPEEGFLETQWYNLVTRESGQTSRDNPDRVVLLRFWADPLASGRSVVRSESVLQRTTDPSVMPRDREMMVPQGHGGWRLLVRVMDAVHERFGR